MDICNLLDIRRLIVEKIVFLDDECFQCLEDSKRYAYDLRMKAIFDKDFEFTLRDRNRYISLLDDFDDFARDVLGDDYIKERRERMWLRF